MKLKMYAVYDDAVKAYRMPHFCETHGQAEREFKSGVNNEKAGHLYTSPEQFTLFHLGEWDDQNGAIEPLPTPQSIIKAVQLKNPDNVRALGT